ncbi:hypothetical protein RJ641_028364 [Dillenia turbinata]|uniref:Uncharacterized protein n=1 Tax=Dillenia turbinata TaxID=194707 RepID=A0AAN8WBU3_9MAGN
MAAPMSISSPLFQTRALPSVRLENQPSLFSNPLCRNIKHQKRLSLTVRAAKPPPGVVLPKVEPKFQAPFFGFTKTAEIWNSRVCMIGLTGIFIVELIINRGILQVIGVEVGKGLNLPL